MRNAEWGPYVARLRAATGISRAELGRRIGKDESTVWRWEAKGQGPDGPQVVERLASLFRLDVDEVLTVAGLRPGGETAGPLPQEYDPEIEEILTAPGIPEGVREQLIEMVLEERRQDEQRRRDRTRRLIDAERRRAS